LPQNRNCRPRLSEPNSVASATSNSPQLWSNL